MKQKKIALVGGGTGGHVFPMKELAKDFEQKNNKITIITDERGAKLLENESIKYKKLPINRFGLAFFLKGPSLFFKSFYWLLKAEKVFFFGGYTTFWPFLAAIILRKERIIYQLDSHITRLNRLLIPFSNKVYYIFAQTNFTKSFLKKGKCFATNMPLREGFKFSYIKNKLPFCITVIGGSLGSNYWKTILKEALEFLIKEERKNIILHIQTKESKDFFQTKDWEGFKEIIISPFFDTAVLFKKSHLIIARSGASSIAEISRIGRPAYLVPWEGAIENHQFFNARNYCEFGGAKFGNDPKELSNYIKKLMHEDKYFYERCKRASIATIPKQV